MQTSQDRFDQLADRTLSVNPKAMRTCPWCLYELDGLLRDANAHPCPGCGEEVSGIINLTTWGKRTRWVPLYKIVIFGWTGFVFVWNFIVFAVMIAGTRGLSEPADGLFYDILMLSVPIFATAMPFVVFGSCYRWMYLCNATRAAGKRLLISTGAVLANLVVALILILPLLSVV